MSPFVPRFAALPSALPIFPLTGALLLPRGELPLNIFEPRYLAMTRDTLAGERLVGMVQPLGDKGDAGEPAVYRIGCAGRLTQFSETEDGRYLITLTGLLRFDIVEELPREGRLYRRVVPDWGRYRGDLDEQHEQHAPLARERFLAALKPFFARHQIAADWQALATADDERLVTAIAMVGPFAPSEKQALLEATDTAERARLLTALLEMAARGGDAGDTSARH
jgi:Lon protease-like protein